MAVASRESSRRWADMLAILTCVTLLALTIWPGGHTASGEAAQALGAPGAVWIARLVAGALAVAAVLVAQTWRRQALGRALLLGGGVLLLVALMLGRVFDARAMLTLALPAVALLVASWGIGPIPQPADRQS